MAFLGREYQYVKQENFDAFLKAAGMPEDQVAQMQEYKPSFKITKDGDTYTLITSTPEKTRETKFKSGVEFDELIRDKIPAKTTYTVDGNTIKQTITSEVFGTGTFLREYNGDELVVTLSAPKFNVTAKRWYKAA